MNLLIDELSNCNNNILLAEKLLEGHPVEDLLYLIRMRLTQLLDEYDENIKRNEVFL